ncbi:MAG: AMP-binding protein, partial [Solirubrobacteraceae bacterium]
MDWLRRAASIDPQRIALETGDQAGISYGALDATARARAAALRRDGVASGDPVPIHGAPGLGFITELHAILLSGAAAVPVDSRLSAEELELRRVSERPRTPACATVMFTSGTTSAPKQVELTAANWEANAVGSAFALGLDPAERWLCVMGLAHVSGLGILIRSAIYGTTVVAHERFDTEAVLSDLMDPSRAVTLVSLVPTMLARLLDAGLAGPPTLRWALLGGG